MVISVGSRSLLRGVFARDGNGKETMRTLGTLEGRGAWRDYHLRSTCCRPKVAQGSHASYASS